MAFFNFRLPGTKGRDDKAPAVSSDSVEVMRRRARHRLIGATVLVAIGVVVFPLLFDTQPRPIPVDVPITIPDRDSAAPLAAPKAPKAADVAAPASLRAMPMCGLRCLSPRISSASASSARSPSAATIWS